MDGEFAGVGAARRLTVIAVAHRAGGAEGAANGVTGLGFGFGTHGFPFYPQIPQILADCYFPFSIGSALAMTVRN
jgi:hypothetical protein